jgi:aspartate aminotransferase-like enzyme
MLRPEILLKMAEAVMVHRGPELEKIFSEIQEGLKYSFQTNKEALIFTSSGTGAIGLIGSHLNQGESRWKNSRRY